jgi:adenylate cyclase
VYGRIGSNAGEAMDARLERKLRWFAFNAAAGVTGGIAFVVAKGSTSPSALVVGVTYGLLLSAAIGGVWLFVLEGPLRIWLGGLSFAALLMVRSVIYAAIIIPILFFQLGDLVVGQGADPTHKNFWITVIYAVAILVGVNLVAGIVNVVGQRALLNLIMGRYHAPVEENRFVLFVDIAGSTGLAERLGGIGIHRLLDRIFRLLSLAVVDYRGEVLNYVGDEVIVTWPERRGAVDCRPLRCFVAMRDELSRASNQLEREFGTAPRIRGSLHFGPVIVGEIGDIKRAIVFNGDVMNTAARLEELSRGVEGGFLVSRAAMERLGPTPPFVVRDLGQLPIRGRAGGIDVFGLDVPALA